MGEMTELSDAESDWIATLIATLSDLEVSSDPDSLDAFIRQSRAASAHRIIDPTPFINLAGAATGQLLVDALDLRWVVFIDDGDARLGLTDRLNETTFFPLAAAARSWSEQESLAQYVAASMMIADRHPSSIAG